MLNALKNSTATNKRAEGLEKLLIIAAIVIPLLGLLIYFREEIKTWADDMWKGVKNDAGTDYEGSDSF